VAKPRACAAHSRGACAAGWMARAVVLARRSVLGGVRSIAFAGYESPCEHEVVRRHRWSPLTTLRC
jgi:hypothetical protein